MSDIVPTEITPSGVADRRHMADISPDSEGALVAEARLKEEAHEGGAANSIFSRASH
jgi:hypothetical protein